MGLTRNEALDRAEHIWPGKPFRLTPRGIGVVGTWYVDFTDEKDIYLNKKYFGTHVIDENGHPLCHDECKAAEDHIGREHERKSHDAFIAEGFFGGHFRGELSNAAAALFKVYYRADLTNQQDLLAALSIRTIEYARQVEGWSEENIINMRQCLQRSAKSFFEFAAQMEKALEHLKR